MDIRQPLRKRLKKGRMRTRSITDPVLRPSAPESFYNSKGQYNEIYKGRCQCGKVIEVISSICSKYTTNILVKCVCGKGVMFTLPVN